MVVGPVTAPLAYPTWRGRLHLAAFFAAVLPGVLVIRAADGAGSRSAAGIYVASLLLVFATSATYHVFARSPRTRAVLRRADHSMIYVLIAGTYTPVCLLALPAAWGIPVLVVVVTGAVVGIAVKLAVFQPARAVTTALYPILGWTAIVAAPVLVTSLTTAQLVLLVAGGVLYTVGVPVLMLHRPDPWPNRFGYHEIWHAFTVAAAVCHFLAVASIVSADAAR